MGKEAKKIIKKAIEAEKEAEKRAEKASEKFQKIASSFGNEERFKSFYRGNLDQFTPYLQGEELKHAMGRLIGVTYVDANKEVNMDNIKGQINDISRDLEPIEDRVKDSNFLIFITEEEGLPQLLGGFDRWEDFSGVIVKLAKYLEDKRKEEGFKHTLEKGGFEWLFEGREVSKPLREFKRLFKMPDFMMAREDWQESISVLREDVREKLKFDVSKLSKWYENCEKTIHSAGGREFFDLIREEVKEKHRIDSVRKSEEHRRKMLKSEMKILGYITLFAHLVRETYRARYGRVE